MFINMSRPIIAAVAGICFCSCINVPQAKQTSFETVTLSRSTVTVPVKWSASLVGKNDVNITPRTDGQLMQVCVSEGDHVKAGQVLFELDNRRASLAVDNAKANLYAAQAQCSSALLEYESNKNLFEKNIVSQYMLSTAENNYSTAKAALEQAQAGRAASELELEFCSVTSPVSGIVGKIVNNPGDQISRLDVLTTIAGNTQMQAKFSVTESNLKDIIAEYGSIDNVLRLLPDVYLLLKDGSKYPYPGKFTSVAGVVDVSTGSVSCRATFPNPDGILYSGIQGTVVLDIDYEDMIVIPLTALVRLQDKNIVYKVIDNCAVSTLVEVEPLADGHNAVILSGASEGDVLVAKGAGNVYDGQQVIFPEKDENPKGRK
ncbi:MAG: efflux RND transporter periplasmic adaptor subunit [Bacteroidales bacterium]|nr:efflux RND transporter periplasmic adaptor subunit [Bacteroidales bacterium]